MFINSHLVPVLLQVIDQVTDLELVIFDGEVGEEDRRKLESVQRGEGKGLRVISIEEVEVIGKRKREETGEVWMGEKADPNQTYCIMYTSGSSESRVRLWIQARRCLSETKADLARHLFVL
jgi:long-subunit acyl-CoA synthetase (AMP-forming)